METNILKLPNELLHLILDNLSGCDLVSFALSCRRFSNLCKTLRSLNFENRHSSLGKSASQLLTFLEEHLNHSLLRSCNFNGCHWIPIDTFTFLINCPNLVELYVAETELSIGNIGRDLLPVCPKITKISFTLRYGDWAAFFAETKTNSRLLKNLKRLISIEIIADDECELCETLRVLNYCDNLEEIVVSRAWLSFVEEVGKKPYDFQRRRKKLYPRLKSLVFIGVPTSESIEQFPFYDVREDCKLTTLWTNVLDINCPELKNCQLKSLSWNSSEEDDEIRPGIRLDHLESYWEPKPLLMKSIKGPTKLKLVSCYFDTENFQEFCRFSPLIEVMKLDCIYEVGGRASPLVWNSESWERLSKLKVLSLQPALIGEEELPWKKKPDEVQVPYVPLMSSVVQNCPLIQELEIMVIGAERQLNKSVATQELSAIAQLIHLKRLTLSKLNVKDGYFIEEILMNCTKLETLRLREINGPPESSCCYIASLCKALPFARKLTTFCLFQLYVVYDTQLGMLLDSLEENCPKLSRLGLLLPSNNKWKIGREEFKTRFIRLCEKLTNLVALYTHFRVPFGHWNETNLALKERYVEERPALRVDLTSPERKSGFSWGGGIEDVEYRSEVLPVMHSDIIFRCESQVAIFPFDCQSFYNRTF